MVGVFDSPDGCSVWCSVTLGRLIDMLPPSPPSLRLLFLHLLLRPTHFLRRWIPAAPPSPPPPPPPGGPKPQVFRGWDGTLPLRPSEGNVNVWDRIDGTHLPLSDLPKLSMGGDGSYKPDGFEG